MKESGGKKASSGRKKKDGYSASERQKMLLSVQTREGSRITGKIMLCPNRAHSSVSKIEHTHALHLCSYV